jgi:hypothetical protein
MIREHVTSDGSVTLEYCCDFGDYSTTNNKGSSGITPIMECAACGRHVCSGHRRFFRLPWASSRKAVYCIECWKIGKKYRDAMMDKAWKTQNDLRLKWHSEGRQNRTRDLASATKTKRELLMVMTTD